MSKRLEEYNMTTVEATVAGSSADKLDFKKILPVFVIVLIDLLGMTVIIPLMPLYAASFGANAFMIGLLGAAYPVMQFIGAPFLGRLSDRYGRRPVLLVSQLGTFIGFLLLGFSNALWLLFLSRIVDGISGANISTAQAAITDSTNEKTRTQRLGCWARRSGWALSSGRFWPSSRWRPATTTITFRRSWRRSCPRFRYCSRGSG